ncbi:MAG TPA: hypothetical protein VHT75_10820 [Acidimicrobiales bacterium]|nr:hypothetical protein [Acidimicrobiales bacterium]
MVAIAAFAALAALAGCGGDKSGGPLGAPETVVGKAPDMTLAQGTARVYITAPTANASGVVDLHGHNAHLVLSASGLAQPADLIVNAGVAKVRTPPGTSYTPLPGAVPPVLQGGDPWADIDLVRGTVHILSNGGGEVEGVSTIGYTLTVDPQQAIETTPPERQDALKATLQGRTTMFQMEVWIDSQFRLRRIEVPYDFSFKTVTPPTRVDGATIATDVDFVTFGVAVPATS